MDLHEYQAKQLLVERGIVVPRGNVATTPDEARAVAECLAGEGVREFVVKAQVHAGGRGLGCFTTGDSLPGVVHCRTAADVRDAAAKMLGHYIVTVQTGSAGKRVSRVLVEAAIAVQREFYAAVLLDRTMERPVLIASGHGGAYVEELFHLERDDIVEEWVDPLAGLRDFQARRVSAAIGLKGDALLACARFFKGIYRTWWECEALMLEINPFTEAVDSQGKPQIVALDAKMSLDDNALYRHPELAALRDVSQEAPTETEARKHGLDYIKLDGNIACLVNGAGLAMATMDAIKHQGGMPANFLDVGGGATQEQITAAFKTILTEPGVRVILVNIFGGITDCAVVARGVVDAIAGSRTRLPIVVRIEGNNSREGREVLTEKLPDVRVADSIEEAARLAVEMAR